MTQSSKQSWLFKLGIAQLVLAVIAFTCVWAGLFTQRQKVAQYIEALNDATEGQHSESAETLANIASLVESCFQVAEGSTGLGLGSSLIGLGVLIGLQRRERQLRNTEQ